MSRNSHRPLEGGAYAWLLTYTGWDVAAFAIDLVKGLMEGMHMCVWVCVQGAGLALRA